MEEFFAASLKNGSGSSGSLDLDLRKNPESGSVRLEFFAITGPATFLWFKAKSWIRIRQNLIGSGSKPDHTWKIYVATIFIDQGVQTGIDPLLQSDPILNPYILNGIIKK